MMFFKFSYFHCEYYITEQIMFLKYIQEKLFSYILEFVSNLSIKLVNFIEKLLLLCNIIRER